MRFTRALRFWLLLASLFGAQMLSVAHGVEHLRGDADVATPHACLLCLATQGMDSVVPTVVHIAVPESVIAAPVAEAAFPAALPRRDRPHARAPPAA